jgi:hypothetical protein
LPLERIAHVFEAPAPVVSNLGRSWSRSHQLSRRMGQRKPFAQLAGKELGLVETPLFQASFVKGYRNRPGRRQPLHHKTLGQEKRERLGQARPALVLETVQRVLDGSFIGNRRAQARQRLEAAAAAALVARGLHLDAAPPAKRLLEAADAATASAAQPRADRVASTASRREEKLEETVAHSLRLLGRSSPS